MRIARFCVLLVGVMVVTHFTAYGRHAQVWAQSSGSRGGVGSRGQLDPGFPTLDHEAAEKYIMIEGSAEVRLPPDEIRVVMAVTHEAETAEACRNRIDGVVGELQGAWRAMGIPAENVVVDFIAVLPRYAWAFERQEGQEVGVERKQGYRMQTNVHLAARNENEAQQAVSRAFQLGLTDIIAFDYWSAVVEDAKQQAREKALAMARRKAESLLFAVVESPLPVINVQEQTLALYPSDLYESFVNSYAEGMERPARRDLPLVSAYRPQNTYYRGPDLSVDAPSPQLPMRPEISVIGRVRLYFRSPQAAVGAPATGKVVDEH